MEKSLGNSQALFRFLINRLGSSVALIEQFDKVIHEACFEREIKILQYLVCDYQAHHEKYFLRIFRYIIHETYFLCFL